MLTEETSELALKTFEKIEFGELTITKPCGERLVFSGHKPGAKADLKIHDLCVLKNILMQGDIALATDYQNQKWDSNDLSTLIEFGIQNKVLFSKKNQKILAKLSGLFKANKQAASKNNIHTHYEISNDFYQLWLDESMSYSSGLFNDKSDNLLQAQLNKYDRIISKIPTAKQNILEIGCGWGGFAERCLQTTKHNFHGITMSESQYHYASKRLAKLPADIELVDYRDITGKYDAIVSIEMFEAIGEKHWLTFFKNLKSLMAESGVAIIQTVTIGDQYFAEYRKNGDAIRNYIFPGGMLPSPTRFQLAAEQAGLKITDKKCFGLDYAQTLEYWLSNVEQKQAKIKQLQLDEKFLRMWRFYLCYCIGAFKANKTNVMQVVLSHA